MDRSRAAREGRRYAAFYHGFKDCRAGRSSLENPYPPGSKEAAYWEIGWKYAGDEP
ncbi:MAG: hypothetical protein HZA50_13885 [Planctomycetes bacterium]|nr:hypothetical protein [Planctomycetota bacterium]